MFYAKKSASMIMASDGEYENGRILGSVGGRSLFESGKLIGILPDEPREIRLNESVEELLKRFSNESMTFFFFTNFYYVLGYSFLKIALKSR